MTNQGSSKPDIGRVMELYKLLVEFRGVKRALKVPPEIKDYENDVEHSYNLAMIGWFLSNYFPKLNSDKIVKIALAHDMVEVHAGDTFVYGPKNETKDKEKREQEAQKKLEIDWKDFPGMLQAIKEYKSRKSPEAKFVYALDKLIPAMMNYLGDGHVWKEHGISLGMVMAEKNKKIPVSPEINDYLAQLFELLKANPQLFPQKRASKE
jgi:putative hydrolase of HD superfamily